MVDLRAISSWGAVIISVIALVTFTGALIASFFFRDPGLLNLTVGAAIAMATTVVNFWIGSSAGSQKKDDTITAMQARSPEPPQATATIITQGSP
jgi:hypothetical protein